MTLQWMHQCCPAPHACGMVMALKRAWLLGGVLAVLVYGTNRHHHTPFNPFTPALAVETCIDRDGIARSSGGLGRVGLMLSELC